MSELTRNNRGGSPERPVDTGVSLPRDMVRVITDKRKTTTPPALEDEPNLKDEDRKNAY